MEKTKKTNLLISALIESWFGVGILIAFIIESILGASSIVLGALAVLMAVLFMNGFAKTDLFFTEQGPAWWRENSSLKIFHHIHDEGELAGIWIGFVLFLYLYFSGHASSVHLPYAAALALAGIMASANMATKNIIPLLNNIEKVVGVWGSVWIGSMMSSLTGAASSVFICRYLLSRVEEKNRPEVATRLAAGIGMGNGILPFVAPPILIVWALVQDKLNWTLADLFLMVGIPSIIYSGFITFKIKKLVSNITLAKKKESVFSIWVVLLLVVIVGNIIAYENSFMMIINALVAMVGITKGADFTEKWQPVILGLLLMALEIIGHMADPFITWLVNIAIPTDMPVLALGIILFISTAVVSHFADNALASRIFVAVIFSMPIAVTNGSFLIASVLIGALFGGFLLIPGNIPNFPIARILSVDSGVWFKSAIKKYWTAILPIAWIVGLYYFL